MAPETNCKLKKDKKDLLKATGQKEKAPKNI